MGSLRDREVAYSASDRQARILNPVSVSFQSSHYPQEVLLAQFSLYVHKGGLKPDSFHFTPSPLSFVFLLPLVNTSSVLFLLFFLIIILFLYRFLNSSFFLSIFYLNPNLFFFLLFYPPVSVLFFLLHHFPPSLTRACVTM